MKQEFSTEHADKSVAVQGIFTHQRSHPYKNTCKLLVFFLALMPGAVLISDAVQDNLGANPVEELTSRTGEWTLWFLLITLSLTPIRMITRFNYINNYRRMMGLFTYFYCVLHLSVFIVLEHALDFKLIFEEILSNDVAQIGLLAFLLLTALAATSTKAAMKSLGKNWKKLHKLIYLISILAILHYVLLVKADYSQPLLYGTLVTALLSIRIFKHYKKLTVSH